MNKIVTYIERFAIIYCIFAIIVLGLIMFSSGETITFIRNTFIIITMFLIMLITAATGPLERGEIMNKHINDTSTTEGETFKTTEMKGTIKLQPEDVEFHDSKYDLRSKYRIDLSKKMVRKLGPNWDNDWDIVDTHLEPHEDFYNIEVVLKRRDNDVR